MSLISFPTKPLDSLRNFAANVLQKIRHRRSLIVGLQFRGYVATTPVRFPKTYY